MSDSPTWLTDALADVASNPDNRELREESPSDVLPGDICVVKPFNRSDGLPRLFLIVETAETWCTGMIAGVETELATDVDVVLEAHETGLGYPIAVHTRYFGPIWTTQIFRRVGAVASEALDEIERLAWNDEAQVSLPVGVPLQPDPIDPRYVALEALSSELDALSDHCRRRRGEFEQPVLDPGLADITVLRAVLAERGWETKVLHAVTSPEFRDRLLTALPNLSPDEQRAVVPLLERAAIGHASRGLTDMAAVLPDHVHAEDLARSVALFSEGVGVRVLSHRLCWHDSPRGSVRTQILSREELIMFEPFSDVLLVGAA